MRYLKIASYELRASKFHKLNGHGDRIRHRIDIWTLTPIILSVTASLTRTHSSRCCYICSFASTFQDYIRTIPVYHTNSYESDLAHDQESFHSLKLHALLNVAVLPNKNSFGFRFAGKEVMNRINYVQFASELWKMA